MVLYDINSNVYVVCEPIVARHCLLYGINGNVHVVGGTIVATHCRLAEWCYMTLTAMYM